MMPRAYSLSLSFVLLCRALFDFSDALNLGKSLHSTFRIITFHQIYLGFYVTF